MENLEQAKSRLEIEDPRQQAGQLINDSKNIYIIPNGSAEPDSVATALALFYTLKELDKNVNLVIGEELPENLKFLIPSLDFISYPKNFVISVPNKVADISQIFYDKDEQGLKIHLTLNRGVIKKDDISFYFSDTKPDLIITLGIKDFKNHMSKKMDSFGFLLDSPILNMDNTSASSVQENKNFGRINLIRDSSLAEIALDLINPVRKAEQSGISSASKKFLIENYSDKSSSEFFSESEKNSEDGLSNGVKNPHIELIKKEAATCFLAGITAYTENFGNSKVTPETFETASLLMKRGADLEQIKDNLFKK